MRKIIIFSLLSLCMISLASCEKNDDENNATRNEWRVKRMYGYNEAWGQYQILFSYADDQLLRMHRCDMRNIEQRDTLGYSSITKSESWKKDFAMTDRVINLDQDSIYRLQQRYPDTYMDTVRRFTISRNIYRTIYDSETFTYTEDVFKPRAFVGSGLSFDNSYLNVTSRNDILEYDHEGKIVVVRQITKIYNPSAVLNSNYETVISKYEFLYQGGRIVSAKSYEAMGDGLESWTETGTLNYTYENQLLVAVEGPDYRLVRSGSQVTVTEKGAVTTYELDKNGNAKRIDYPDGSCVHLEYERGKGNVAELLRSPFYRLLGKDFIK